MTNEKLTQLADYFADAKLHDFEETVLNTHSRIKGLEEQVSNLVKALEIYKRERDRFRHAHPEITGEYFLSGGHGEEDTNLLPQFVTIVPAYGAGWEQIYERTERTISYEGS